EDDRRLRPPGGLRADPRGSARGRVPEPDHRRGQGLGPPAGGHGALPWLPAHDQPPAQAQDRVRGRNRPGLARHGDHPAPRAHRRRRRREDLRAARRAGDPCAHRRVGAGSTAIPRERRGASL
ncbi:MAG: Nitrogen regulatory protein P-II, partial [uncultured Solirubrobacterales bacterium]